MGVKARIGLALVYLSECQLLEKEANVLCNDIENEMKFEIENKDNNNDDNNNNNNNNNSNDNLDDIDMLFDDDENENNKKEKKNVKKKNEKIERRLKNKSEECIYKVIDELIEAANIDSSNPQVLTMLANLLGFPFTSPDNTFHLAGKAFKYCEGLTNINYKYLDLNLILDKGIDNKIFSFAGNSKGILYFFFFKNTFFVFCFLCFFCVWVVWVVSCLICICMYMCPWLCLCVCFCVCVCACVCVFVCCACL